MFQSAKGVYSWSAQPPWYRGSMTPDNQKEESRGGDDLDFKAMLEKSTLPLDVGIHIDGRYQSEDEARDVWLTTLTFLRVFGASLNLAGVEAVTIADDYSAVLAHVERGFETTQPLAPSNDEFGTGLAMAVPVFRDGCLKTHIVLHSGISRALLQPDCEVYKEAIYTLAHEAAHAHDHLLESRAVPGLYGTRIYDHRDGRLFTLAHMCWNEYIACRLSATWGTETYCKNYSDSLCGMLSSARKRGGECFDRYSGPAEIQRTENELVQVYGTLLVRTSYLVGHIHGLNATVAEKAPEFHSLVNQTLWFKPIFEKYEENVRGLYHGYADSWHDIQVFEPLKLTFEALLNAGGMFYQRLPTGDYFIGLRRPVS